MFKHFLITRFNLRRDDWTTNKKKIAVLTEEWHKNRFKLFNDYCFPSVKSQTNTDFLWLVHFDTTTPDKYKKIISSLQEEMANFIPIFIDGMSNSLPSIKSYINDFDEEYIITSTLDNDDCISKHYIEEVQNRFDKQEFMALDFIDGFTIQTQSEIKIGKKLHQYNPFISLFEKNNVPKTVFFYTHRNWKKEKNVLQVRGIKIWSSVIHHENKVNEFTGYGKVSIDDFFEDFKIDSTQQKYIEANNLPLSKWRLESVLNNLSSYWKYRFKNFKKWLGFYKKN